MNHHQILRSLRAALLVWTMTGATLIACNKQSTESPTANMDSVRSAAESPSAAPSSSPLLIQNVGFETPESVYYLAADDMYLVSNINGVPSAKDNNGFISRVRPDGSVENLKWISGAASGVTLHAPKGMAVKDDLLYVTDIDTIRAFHLDTGKPAKEISFRNVSFLNDLTSGPDGRLYVSDTGFQFTESGMTPTFTDAIWVLSDNGPEQLIASTDLHRPNGLLGFDGGVWVVTNEGMQLYPVSPSGVQGARVTLPEGGLDGIVRTNDGTLLISSWEAKAIFSGPAQGPFTKIIGDITSPADIGYDSRRNRLLVPIFLENAVKCFDLTHPSAETP